jgi:decaprenylphospho-beta-D-erythro-pentofuranosid-2-ulose 2-reductase
MERVLILGAKSDIARALAHRFALAGHDIILAARRATDLENDAQDLQIRYKIHAEFAEFNALDYDSHPLFYSQLDPKPAGVVCAVGYLGDQKLAERDFGETKKLIDTNFTGCVSILNIIANDFEARKKGFIIGISSVAGDRGRQSNYIYGSAKAAFTAYMSGLRNRLQKHGLSVLTVKPGFVATKMTEGMDLPQLLTSLPEEVAEDVFRAYKAGKDVRYTKWFWKWIMTIIRIIPEKIFKKMNL